MREADAGCEAEKNLLNLLLPDNDPVGCCCGGDALVCLSVEGIVLLPAAKSLFMRASPSSVDAMAGVNPGGALISLAGESCAGKGGRTDSLA